MTAIKNKKGQVLIEMILVMAVLVGASIFVSSQFRESNFIAQLVSGPWKNLAGMIQNGVWEPREAGMASHPASPGRWISPIGEPAEN